MQGISVFFVMTKRVFCCFAFERDDVDDKRKLKIINIS